MARSSRAKDPTEHDDDAETPSAPVTRGIWSGSISFGLLQIPVTLYSAERRNEEVHFRMLDKRDLTPVKFERVNAGSGKSVAWKDIVKGYEIEKDQFVVLDPEDLKKANVKATQTIDIQDFVPAADIDATFFETPYFLVPQRRATKAYVLLKQALEKRKAAAIATFVLRTREHLAALIPTADGILLEVLRFGHELREPGDLPLPDAENTEIAARELAMAEQLIDGMMTDWKPARYKDRYYRDVMAMIEEKAKTGKTKAHHSDKRGKVASNVVDLLDLLKKSVDAHKPSSNDAAPVAKSKPRKKTATKRTRRTEAA